MSSSPSIVVTGFMGSGKTTVARSLARVLQREMIDLDQFITEQDGRSPREIIEQDGEPAFREIETRFLAEVLETSASIVIALGGGAWTTPANRVLIEQSQGQSVWLDAPFELCWRRITAAGSERPLARDREQARNLYQLRRPIYQLASLHVKTSQNLSGKETAVQIANALGQLPNRER